MYLLFERLTNDPIIHSIAELRAAIKAQLQRVITTHVISRSDNEPETLNMGIPSVSEMARGSQYQMELWSLRLQDLIIKFEPRIDLSDVALEQTGNAYAPLKIAIEGQLRYQDEVDTMRFNIDLS